MKKIVIGSDHAGYYLKQFLYNYLQTKGYEIINLGTNSPESVDYPIYGKKIGEWVTTGKADLGIAICGSGIGIGISANKIPGCRAAICSDPYSAKMSRLHNNANVLAIGARVVGEDLAKMIVDTWLNSEFLGGRHEQRVQMIEN
ncbi:ribose 5-phosphate isomerase B [Sporolactobacillus shoreicorticis]|uniref:Ribose 5-phosphate isomerase B n=1 Tax=Sporolactobacillus shoreicorticis TaxID=1923877 RepID=A0ABW5S0U2_9BACL|nr:ribose 5-phosphate isomerase B [Sporolactobacillus shoreicorticis]MCO7124480.1 ribose 5-phosphate isomerase B [Sporolactobacillus shoreicorticis]